jgi:hypothetical protein
MKILSFCLKITFLAAIAILSMTSCKKDEAVPDTARITGTVFIDNADLWAMWKDSGDVQLALFPEFSLNPPAGWGDIPDGYFGPGIPGGRFALGAPTGSETIPYSAGLTQFSYTITVDPGTYSCLALGFRNNRIADPSSKTATLGVFWDHPDSTSHGIVILPNFNEPAPTVFTLKKGDNVIINFKADFAFVNEWYH